ncbi:MAG TPA: S9 family peptidase [Abditibacterium sp.]|jgi:dipeptidyl aminopeptidase/acylaminoacyl peptidase
MFSSSRVAFLAATVVSFAAAAVPARAALPPLIPRNLLFGNPEKVGPQISPDGKRLAYVAPYKGVLNIWVKTIGKTDDRVLSKSTTRPVTNYGWAENARQLIYAKDTGGDENYHLYLCDIASGAEKDLTPFPKVNAAILASEPAFPDTLVVQMNKRDPRMFDAYRLNLKTGQVALAAQNPGNVVGWLADSKLKVRAAVAMLPDGGTQVLVRDSETAPMRTLASFAFGEEGGPVSFSNDGKKMYFISDKGVNTKRLYEADVATGAMKLIHARENTDLSGLILHPTRKTVEAVGYNRLRQEWVPLEPSIKADLDVLKKAVDGEPTIVSRDTKDQTWLVSYLRDNGPVTYYTYNRATKKPTFLFTARPALEKHKLAKMTPVEITTRDGMKLVSYLTLPVGVPAKKLPMVLNVHGGPWARDSWGYNGEVQWLANRGYAVLQVNFRGSTGFGKKFVSAADRQWGLKMHNDLVDATQWAISKGYADPKRVAIYGGSYGGYAVLTGLTKTPQLFAAGVDMVGVSNLLTFMQTIPPYWEPLRPMLTRRVGDLKADEAMLKANSPVNFADQIVKPLLIAQGANDPRVNKAESDQIVRAVRKNGKDVTYLLFADEGHGFARPINRLKFYAATEAFLAKNIGGRAEAPKAGEEPPIVAPGQEGAATSTSAVPAPATAG